MKTTETSPVVGGAAAGAVVHDRVWGISTRARDQAHRQRPPVGSLLRTRVQVLPGLANARALQPIYPVGATPGVAPADARPWRLVPFSTPVPKGSLRCQAERREAAVLRAMLGMPPEPDERTPPLATEADPMITPSQETLSETNTEE